MMGYSSAQVPFVLVEGGIWPHPDYVIVNMDGSRHPLPLVTVYHHLQPITASPYTFLQALFGHDYPVSKRKKKVLLMYFTLELNNLFPPTFRAACISFSNCSFY